MNDLTPFECGHLFVGGDLDQLPTKASHAGYQGHIYIIEFDNKTIKVGKAADPRARIRAHLGNALPMGRSIVRVWVSPVHANYSANERALIEFGHAASSSAIRVEYFIGLSFERVRKFATTLQYEALDIAAMEAREQAAREPWLRASMARRALDMVSVPRAYVDAAERWLSPTFGISPNPKCPRGVPDSFADGDPDEMYECAQRLADIKGLPLDEILDMSVIDLLGDLLHSMVDTEIAHMKIFAYENDRWDMVRQGRAFGGAS